MNNSDIHEQETLPPPAPALRGFAWLKANRPDKFLEICQRGGATVAAKGNGHRFTPEEASAAGKKGGKACHEKRARAYKEQGR